MIDVQAMIIGVFFYFFYFFVRANGLIAPFFQPTLCQGVPPCIDRGVVDRRPEICEGNQHGVLLRPLGLRGN